MLDKYSENWQKAPKWVSFGLLGFKERKQAIITIVLLLICGVAFYLNSGWGTPLKINSSIWLCFYMAAVAWFTMAVRWVDKKGLW